MKLKRKIFKEWCEEDLEQRGYLLNEWDYEANHILKPEDVTTGSHKIVSWKCEKGHTWRRSVKAEIKSLGCPFCVGVRT